jgi:hypothetical protein
MSADLPESALPPPTGSGESPSAPTRRTFIATGTAVGGAVVAGGVAGGTFLAGSDDAAAAGAVPSSRVSLTVDGIRRTRPEPPRLRASATPWHGRHLRPARGAGPGIPYTAAASPTGDGRALRAACWGCVGGTA